MATAIILGAGASKALGYRLTNELLPGIVTSIEDGTLFAGTRKDGAPGNRRRLAEGIRDFMPGLDSIPRDRWPLITELLSNIDYLLNEGTALKPKQSAHDLLGLRHLVERGIYEMIRSPVSPSENERASRKQLRSQLRAWIESLADRGGVGIASTNYDLSIENELFPNREEELPSLFDFGFPWLDTDTENRTVHMRPANARYRLYKIHGSLNWLRCDLCGGIYLHREGRIAFQAFRSVVDADNTCHCGHARLQMLIVAPSLIRTVRDPHVVSIWRNTLQLLQDADEWVIIGYSIPPEDLAIRTLLMQALHSRTSRASVRIQVVQRSNDAEPRYRLLFPKCEYHAGGLEKFLNANTNLPRTPKNLRVVAVS
jgi:hypothetical protein